MSAKASLDTLPKPAASVDSFGGTVDSHSPLAASPAPSRGRMPGLIVGAKSVAMKCILGRAAVPILTLLVAAAAFATAALAVPPPADEAEWAFHRFQRP